jgi:hypothetical protein
VERNLEFAVHFGRKQETKNGVRKRGPLVLESNIPPLRKKTCRGAPEWNSEYQVPFMRFYRLPRTIYVRQPQTLGLKRNTRTLPRRMHRFGPWKAMEW